VDFFPVWKIRRLRSGANPRSWVPEARMLTTRPPKPRSQRNPQGRQILSALTVLITPDMLWNQLLVIKRAATNHKRCIWQTFVTNRENNTKLRPRNSKAFFSF
jgi:hypothetical protein